MSLGYDKPSALTILTFMDTVYYAFDISMEEAKEIAEYAVENEMRLTEAMKEKWNVDFYEVNEFFDTVMEYNVKFMLEKTKLSLD